MAMPSADSSGERERIAEEAGQWVARLDRGLSVQEQAWLTAWLAGDERCLQEFTRIQAAWTRLDQLPASLGETARGRSASAPRFGWRPVLLWSAGLGAAAAIVGLAGCRT